MGKKQTTQRPSPSGMGGKASRQAPQQSPMQSRPQMGNAYGQGGPMGNAYGQQGAPRGMGGKGFGGLANQAMSQMEQYRPQMQQAMQSPQWQQGIANAMQNMNPQALANNPRFQQAMQSAQQQHSGPWEGQRDQRETQDMNWQDQMQQAQQGTPEQQAQQQQHGGVFAHMLGNGGNGISTNQDQMAQKQAIQAQGLRSGKGYYNG